MYRIILWEYFSPEYYFLEHVEKGKKKICIFATDEHGVFRSRIPKLFSVLQDLQTKYTKLEEEVNGFALDSVEAAINSINTEPAIYVAKNGAANTPTGHGIFFEDVGSVIDKLHGTDSSVVGRDNAQNGPDKLVNINVVQLPIQCKCCASASKVLMPV